MVKDSGKIIWGDRKIYCKPIMKCILKGIDLRNKVQKIKIFILLWRLKNMAMK